MKELHTAGETREHFRNHIPNTSCALCYGELDTEDNRGIIEYYDGWRWICSKCKEALKGTMFDLTGSEDWGKQDTIPYSACSHKRSLRYLQKEYGVVINSPKNEHSEK